MEKKKRIVLTYGTFDLLHEGHAKLLKRAKGLGDFLIVGVTTPEYDRYRGKLNVVQSLEERKAAVAQLGYADMIIEEAVDGQKVHDIQKFGADVITFGSDWRGKFDYLKKYCEVVYLERTKGISSSSLRNSGNRIISMGIAGNGRIAHRLAAEAYAVSGLEITSVFGRNEEHCREFAKKYELSSWETNYDDFLEPLDAVYIALPHHLHVDFTQHALERGKHVLCEKPMTLHREDVNMLYDIATKNNCVLMEAFKTLWTPSFQRVISMVREGEIGTVHSVDAAFTKLVTDRTDRVYDPNQAGGAFTELASYPLLAISRILGKDVKSVEFHSFMQDDVDIYTRVNMRYEHAIASATVGIGVKREGDMVIAGTKGYIYVPAPWWKIDCFELRREDVRQNQRYVTPFEGDGLRYELAEFVRTIKGGYSACNPQTDSTFIAEIIEQFRSRDTIKDMFD